MKTIAHNVGTSALTSAFTYALQTIKLDHALLHYSGSTIALPNETTEPDSVWDPTRAPPGHPKRPTVILEITLSGSYARLSRDVEMWVDPARGNVRVALAMKINRREPLVKLERYEWNAASQESRRTQAIVMKKSKGQVTIFGAPLIIHFDILFERTPKPTNRDIGINQAALRQIAGDIWCAQNFE